MFKTNFSGHNKIWGTQKIRASLLPNAVACRWGGERSAGPGHPRQGGHSKSEITKI